MTHILSCHSVIIEQITAKMNIIYRSAEEDDCLQIAELINIASGGLLNFLFYDLTTQISPVQIVAQYLQEDRSHYTYKNVLVAELKNEILGMILAYSSEFYGMTEDMKHFLPGDRLEHLEEMYYCKVSNSFFIDTLSVHEKYHKRGIGSTLMSLAYEKAIESGFNTLSLIVFADNTNALSFYKKHGFQIVKKIKIDYHPLIPHQGGAYLMKCDIR
jgi:ribosomal protein S18 acetylase RimI-like enzyme